jgi:acetolactate synthase-1/2/3 large subunit
MSADGSPLSSQAAATPVVAKTRTAAEVLVDQLMIHGVKHVFCVPGESFLGVLDALYDRDITVTVCRQEGGAAMMAEAFGKATGRPGVCFVTRGPGATNASAGIHIAQQDSSPMIMFVGQVEQAVRDREAFQEMDYRAVFGSMTKWTAELDDPARVPEYVARAFNTAMNGRPGPVVIALPKNMLTERVVSGDAPPAIPVETSPGAPEMERLAAMIAGAQRPIFVLNGSRWDDDARAAVHRFAERFDMPVMTGYRRAPLFDALDPHYAGDLGLAPNPKLVARVKASDLVVVVGGRLSEITVQGYSLFDTPNAVATGARPKLVHVCPGVEELGKVFTPDLAIHATPSRFAAALDAMAPPAEISWNEHTRSAHADYLAWTETPTPQPGDVNLGAIMVWLRESLAPGSVICNGSGNFAAWIHRFYRFRGIGTHIASTSASMGYGVPAAVAMQRLHPDRTIVSINGDGDFLMNGQEFATAVQYDLPIVVLVFDNGIYGTIRMHQERAYPGRVSATTLRNPDFAAYARAFGGFGATVEKTQDFAAAFEAAVASGLPSIVHVKFDPDGITPTMTLSGIRAAAARG